MDTSEKDISQDKKDDSTKEGVNRRKALGLAAAGVTGLLLSNIVNGQSGNQQNGKVLTDESQQNLRSDSKIPKPQKSKGLLKKDIQRVSFTRDVDSEKIWTKLEIEIEKSLNITDNNEITGQLSSSFQRIESGFSFSSSMMDEEFIPTHVEPLIDQAADLLDRCLRDRNTWDELSVKMFDLALELKEFKELDKIHLEEEAAGLYDTPWKQSVSDYNAELINRDKAFLNNSILDWMLTNKFNYDQILKICGAMQLSAVLQGLPPYYWEGQRFSSYGQLGWNGGAPKNIYEHHKLAAADIGYFNLNLQRDNLQIQKYFIESLLEASKEKLEGLEAKAIWDKINANFQRRRTIVSRNTQDKKTKATIADDGVLNYLKRLVPLKERFQRDFRDALARMKAVEKGLLIIYGYEFPLPTDESAIDYYDRCLIWCRSVIQWLLKFSRKELNTIYPISISQLVGGEQFKRMRKDSIWNFSISEKNLPNMSNLRLRGISVSILDNQSHKDRLWQFEIIAPDKATIRHFITGKSIEIDQSFLTPCIIGRVTERESPKAPDVVGLTSLYNSSPIGTWKLTATNCIPQKRCEKIDDVTIDLHLAYRHFNNSEIIQKK